MSAHPGCGCCWSMLREQQVIAEKVAPPPSALDVLINRYRVWMIEDPGLAATTVLRYENLARRLLQDRWTDAGVDDPPPRGGSSSDLRRPAEGSAPLRLACDLGHERVLTVNLPSTTRLLPVTKDASASAIDPVSVTSRRTGDASRPEASICSAIDRKSPSSVQIDVGHNDGSRRGEASSDGTPDHAPATGDERDWMIG